MYKLTLPLVVVLSLTCIYSQSVFSFILNQSQSLSMSFDLVVKDELGMEEPDVVYATNLPVFPLHFLKVDIPNAVMYNVPFEQLAHNNV